MIPNIDPIALPAPVWLIQFLQGLTFVLHVIPMNIILGGGILAAVFAFIARRGDQPQYERLARALAYILPAATAATITLGIPPLLFVQVLYGPLFYTSSVLMAWPWISVIALLLAGYYGFYWFALKKDKEGRLPLIAAIIAAVAVLAISFLFSNNMQLMLHPEQFGPAFLEADAKVGGGVLASDPWFLPRYLHFLVAAISVAGLLVMLVGLFGRKDKDGNDDAFGPWAIKLGGLIFVVATVIQYAVGVWQLIALRPGAMMQFMGQDTLWTAIIGVALLLSLVALVLILVAALGTKPAGMTISGIGAIVVTIVLMTLMRGMLRDFYVAETFPVAAQPADPQWFVVILFLLLLVAGLATVIWMLHAVITKKGAGAQA